MQVRSRLTSYYWSHLHQFTALKEVKFANITSITCYTYLLFESLQRFL